MLYWALLPKGFVHWVIQNIYHHQQYIYVYIYMYVYGMYVVYTYVSECMCLLFGWGWGVDRLLSGMLQHQIFCTKDLPLPDDDELSDSDLRGAQTCLALLL